MSQSRIYNFIPDAILVCSITVAYFLSKLFPIAQVITFPLNLIGWMVILFAFSLALSVLSSLKSKHTSTDVVGVPSVFITDGLYKYSRNPFYFLSLLTTVGVALVLGTIAALIAPLLYFLTLQLIIIPIEETQLHIQFGREYEKYKNKVRRWA